MRTMSLQRRYVVGNWIAAGTTVASAAIGSVLLLSARDRLPTRVVLHWNDGRPDVTSSLGIVLTLTALATVGLPMLILVLGRLAAGSWRHTWSSGALTAGVAPALTVYGTVWAQRNGTVLDPPPSWVFVGVSYGIVAGNVLRSWLRPRTRKTSSAPARLNPSPHPVRRAWVGEARMPWSVRLGTSLTFVALVALVAWLTDAWIVTLFMGAAAMVVVAHLSRAREVAVDYSGVGLRGAGASRPAPLKMGEVRAVSARHVSALRDFGGWGYRTAVDGTEGWITRSGEALVVHRWDKPDFVFTVDDATGAAAVLQSFLTPSEVA